MSNVINKSNHPVEIKKISLSLWSLRTEIETAIAQKLASETPGNTEPDIEDVKIYYTSILNNQIEPGEEDDGDERQDENLDSSGNPMDDDAAAMLAALGGGEEDSEGDDDSETEAEEGDSEAEDSSDEEKEEAAEEDSQDDEAAALAAQMLADQGLGGDEDEDDEAAALAAQMLADQGMGGDTAATDENGESEENSKSTTSDFERPIPQKTTDAFLMLSDINMENCLLFTKGPFIQGQNIVIQFNIPNSFKLLATVVRCRDISRNSKIISSGKPSHRIYCAFEYKFPGERSSLREFLKSIEPTIPAPPKKMKRPETEDEDDDFDDLGF